MYWERLGRRCLENRVLRLIESDGCFSQYSLNYHRMVIDALCMAEVWRDANGLAPFSETWQNRAASATQWLHAMIEEHSGHGFNVGANDGSLILKLTDTNYRDFRPSVQLAAALFLDATAFQGTGQWNQPMRWLGVKQRSNLLPRANSQIYDCGGFAFLTNNGARVLMRYPRFKFRPSQADALHVDFWVGNRNLLRDAGTYSYNTDQKFLNYFSSPEAHNTIQFDRLNQML